MRDILAVLDAAIDEIAPATSRSSRQRDAAGAATGSGKSLNCKAIPVLPVIPVPKRGDHEDRRERRSQPNAKSGGGSHAYISFSTGSTGSTGTFEHSCGFQRSRDREIQREVTGSTGRGTPLAVDLDRLDPDHPPGDVPRARWAQFLEDARELHASGFGEQARALGWTEADLFGCDDTRPFARIDRMGLVWLLNGDRIVALTAEAAVIEAKSGARTMYRKKGWPSRPAGMLMPRFSAGRTKE